MSIIEIQDVKKTYRMGAIELQALRGVSLRVERGEMLAIMGPSGSGKSTLMNIVGCLDQPSEGKYLLDGVEVHTLNDDQLAKIRNQKIGFVFQTFNLLSRTSALDNVELPMIYAGSAERRRRAQAVLEQVGLGDRIHHRPNELSGGQQQRVAIARALINHPSIILADEPTGNLDTHSSQDILGLLEELHNSGVTIVMVTHEPDIADYAQRVILLRDGEVASDVHNGHNGHGSVHEPSEGRPA
jgi:putative ABC transport system ATP-binding protein